MKTFNPMPLFSVLGSFVILLLLIEIACCARAYRRTTRAALAHDESSQGGRHLEPNAVLRYVLRVMLLYALIALVVSAAWYFVGHSVFGVSFRTVGEAISSETLSAASDYGSAFNFVSSLFTGLAFAGVITALVLQTIELRLQRQEMDETQRELRRTAEAQESTAQMQLRSISVLKEQAELQSMAGYVSCLVALLGAPPETDRTIGQDLELSRLRGMADEMLQRYAPNARSEARIDRGSVIAQSVEEIVQYHSNRFPQSGEVRQLGEDRAKAVLLLIEHAEKKLASERRRVPMIEDFFAKIPAWRSDARSSRESFSGGSHANMQTVFEEIVQCLRSIISDQEVS